VADLYQQ